MVNSTSDGLQQAKYENAILYFVQHCNNHYLGATKLNKLLYYLDFLHYRDEGATVTGDEYVHLEYGPVPKKVTEIIGGLCEKGSLEVIDTPFGSTSRKSYVAKTPVDEAVFSETEKQMLRAICERFKKYDTDTIVAQTHLEAPWFYSKPYQTIDYEYAHSIEVFSEGEDDDALTPYKSKETTSSQQIYV